MLHSKDLLLAFLPLIRIGK